MLVLAPQWHPLTSIEYNILTLNNDSGSLNLAPKTNAVAITENKLDVANTVSPGEILLIFYLINILGRSRQLLSADDHDGSASNLAAIQMKDDDWTFPWLNHQSQGNKRTYDEMMR